MDKNTFPHPRGWDGLIERLKNDLQRIAPGMHITEIGVSDMGRMLCHYSDRDLTPQQQVMVDARVRKAEEAAWQTCVKCGRLGSPAWITPPPLARVFCAEHKPEQWNSLEG